MDFLSGVSCLAAGLLVYAFGYGAHRRPVPSRWTRLPGATMAVCLVAIYLVPVGLGLIGLAAVHPLEELASMTAAMTLVTVGIVALAVVGVPLALRPAKGAMIYGAGQRSALVADHPAATPAGPAHAA